MADQGVLFIKQPARVEAGEDGLIHIEATGGMPPLVVPRSVAISFARALLAAVATIEDREAAARLPPRIGRRGKAG